jgi:hypothetical protein
MGKGYPNQKVKDFMLDATDIERALDVVELTFMAIDTTVRANPVRFHKTQSPDEAIDELNARFREQGVGFEFQSGRIVRVDSQILHAEVTKPALKFLSEAHLAGANQEFMSAHVHYRHGRFKECLNDCLKAFESTMKAICAKRGWTFQPTDTAKTLLEVIFKNDLIPSFMQSHFTALRSTLEAGVPTVRNKLGGHGQGLTEIEVPHAVAAYALHLSATNILFLAESDKERK